MYYDASTEYITTTSSSTASTLLSTTIITNTPSPTSNIDIEPPDMQEMESNAVVMSMNNITIQEVSHFSVTLSLPTRVIVDPNRKCIFEHNSKRVYKAMCKE